MVDNIIETFYSNVPAVICAAGSYVAGANDNARMRAGSRFEGNYLFDFMEPSDVLRYEAYFCSNKDEEVFSFPLSGFFGFSYGAAVFESILGRRFAVVFLSGNEMEVISNVRKILSKKESKMQNDSIYAFAKEILAIPEYRFQLNNKGITDIKSATKASIVRIKSIYRFKDIDIEVLENEEMKRAYYMPIDISLSVYFELLMLILSAVGETGKERKLKIKLCKYGMSAEVRISVPYKEIVSAVSDIDDLCAVVPASASYITVCEYIAGTANSLLTVKVDGKSGELTYVLSFGEYSDTRTDFKCMTPPEISEDQSLFVLKYIDKLSKRRIGAEQG